MEEPVLTPQARAVSESSAEARHARPIFVRLRMNQRITSRTAVRAKIRIQGAWIETEPMWYTPGVKTTLYAFVPAPHSRRTISLLIVNSATAATSGMMDRVRGFARIGL